LSKLLSLKVAPGMGAWAIQKVGLPYMAGGLGGRRERRPLNKEKRSCRKKQFDEQAGCA